LYVEEEDIPAYVSFNEGVAAEGRYDSGAGRYDSGAALHYYLEALRMKPNLYEALLNLGCLYDKLSEAEASESPGLSEDHAEMATRTFNSLLSASPPPSFAAGAYNNLGHIAHKRSSNDVLALPVAVSFYEKAIAQDPAHTDSLYNLGKVLQELGRWEEARAAYERVLALEPDHHESRLNLANYYFGLHDSSSALRQYELILASPSLSSLSSATLEMVLNNLGSLHRTEHDFPAALAVYERAYVRANVRANRFQKSARPTGNKSLRRKWVTGEAGGGRLREKRASERAGGGCLREKRASEGVVGGRLREKRASEGAVGGRPPEPPLRPARLHMRETGWGVARSGWRARTRQGAGSAPSCCRERRA
jgi:hypothetical protein